MKTRRLEPPGKQQKGKLMNIIKPARNPGIRRFAARNRPEADRRGIRVPKPNPKKRPLRAPTATLAPERTLAQQSEEWTEPKRLATQLPAVPPFNAKLLPARLRLLAQDIAERMQVPLDFTAVALIATLAGVCGRRVQIQPKANDSTYVEAPNLWGALVGPPGTRKTSVIQAATKPVHAIEAGLHAPGIVTKRRLMTTDPTFEKLHEMLAANPGGIFVLRDELTGWLAGLEKKGREPERAFYLEGWNGNTPFTVDRIGRGTVLVPHTCITLFGAIQPDRLQAYLADVHRNGSGNDGLIQRFQLLVWPDRSSDYTWQDRPPDKRLHNQFAATCRRIASMDADVPLILKFSPEAQKFFVSRQIYLQRRLQGDTLRPCLQAHLSKYPTLMAGLALLLALSEGPQKDVGLEYAQQAAGWCRYLEGHAYRVYASGLSRRDSATVLGDKLIGGWKRSDGKFTLREVYRNQWTGLKTPDEAQAALRVLEEAGWVR
jgi:putative DNA primase/helicase